ncbi:MAG: DUF4340 domain-containing protein [Ruminococcaceae bacterium]|nr:DUF4340 domain-containing protein [Oscillospiraceae bacterium]
MKKQMRPILITVIACLVVAGALLLVLKLIPNEAETITPSNTAGDSMMMVIQKSATAVEKAEFKTDSGEKFTIKYTLDESGNQVATLIGGDDDLAYNNTTMYDLAGHLGYMAAIQQIENADDKDFGFHKPQREIKISYTDETVIELTVGKNAPSGDGVYIKREDTKEVYLIGGATQRMLMNTLQDYRVFTLFGPYNKTTDIRKVTIERKDEDKLIVVAKSGEVSTSEETSTAQYEIISPAQADVANDALETNLLKPLISIEAETLVEDKPKDLAKYGLDNPTRVEFEDADKKKVSFLIGTIAENGGNYVMLEGSNSVVMTKQAIPFIGIDYTDLMLKLIWLHNMDTVSSIRYQIAGGENHSLEFSTTTPITGTYDGGSISDDNLSNLFLLTVRFTLQGKLESSMKYGAPKLTIQMKLKNGSETTLQLAEINERHYAAIIDGEARYYVNVTQVNELFDAFDTLASGGTIPDMF